MLARRFSLHIVALYKILSASIYKLIILLKSFQGTPEKAERNATGEN